METYMNKPEVKKRRSSPINDRHPDEMLTILELGAPADITFQSCNMQINQAL